MLDTIYSGTKILRTRRMFQRTPEKDRADGSPIHSRRRTVNLLGLRDAARAHSVQYGKPSLVCDLQELYRSLVDDFVIQFCQSLGKRDFTVKSEAVSKKRMGKREYLNDAETRRMMGELGDYFESKVDIPLIRHGKRQRIETLINEEALLLAKYIRGEVKTWIPRVAI